MTLTGVLPPCAASARAVRGGAFAFPGHHRVTRTALSRRIWNSAPVHTSKKMIAASFAAALIGAALIPGAAQATDDKPLAWADCANLKGWSPNADEQDRRPTPTADGLKFTGSQLVHHPISLSVAKLKPGSFVASPTPDQNSFFSVEVRNNDGTGYATLRWNTATDKWEMSTGGQQYVNTDPALLVEMTTPAKSHNLISFGVGYTKNPPGTVATTVERVRFMGKTYPLTCKPKPSPSVSQSHSASPSASASGSASTSHSASASASRSSDAAVTGLGDNGSSGGLPVTGAAAGGIAGGAAVLLAAGGVLFVMARRRKVKFTA